MKTLIFVLLINSPNQAQTIVYQEEMAKADCLHWQQEIWNGASPVAYWLEGEAVRTLDAACIPVDQM